MSLLLLGTFTLGLLEYLISKDRVGTADLLLLHVRMYHVVHFLKLLLPIEKEFVFSDQPSQVDQFKLLELLGRLLIGFDHGRAHVHYHHDTEAEYQLDHHLTEHSENGRHDTEGQLIALLDILVIG